MGEYGGVELAELVLSGPRLTLRPWQSGDADDVYRAMRDDALAHEFLPLPSPYTLEHAQHFVAELGDEGRAAGTGFGCALVENDTGRLVGSAALRLHGGVGEIGYAVYPWGRGSGFAAEATRVLTSWAFEHDVPRVQLYCAVTNLASARTALDAGFRYEGITRGLPLPSIDPSVAARRGDVALFARVVEDAGEPVRPQLPQVPREDLSDGVVALRCLQPEDAQASLETDDALAMRWAFSAEPPTLEQARRNADEAGLEWLVGIQGRLAIIDAATGRVAGSMMLRLPGPPGVALVGYGVHPDFRGRGYTTQALRLLAPWAFSAGIVRLELGAKIDNVASQQAALNAGFVQEGIYASRLRNPDGSYSDEARFALVNR